MALIYSVHKPSFLNVMICQNVLSSQSEILLVEVIVAADFEPIKLSVTYTVGFCLQGKTEKKLKKRRDRIFLALIGEKPYQLTAFRRITANLTSRLRTTDPNQNSVVEVVSPGKFSS